MSDLLTTEEAAKLLRISKEQMKLWRRDGTGPSFVRVSPKIIRYDREDIVAWIAAKKEITNGTSKARSVVVGSIQFPR